MLVGGRAGAHPKTALSTWRSMWTKRSFNAGAEAKAKVAEQIPVRKNSVDFVYCYFVEIPIRKTSRDGCCRGCARDGLLEEPLLVRRQAQDAEAVDLDGQLARVCRRPIDPAAESSARASARERACVHAGGRACAHAGARACVRGSEHWLLV